jgi:hypothetical protein
VEISFTTRLSLLFVVGVVGLVWQGIIVTLGGEASSIMIGAFTTMLLATIGIGITTNNGNGVRNNARDDKKN